MRCSRRSLKLLLWTALAATFAPAQPFTVRLNPAKTVVGFTLGDVLHTVHGAFQLKGGTIEVDPATYSMSGEVIVDATSGNSGNRARDRRMENNVLQVQKYPVITFSPTRITGPLFPTGSSSVEITGWFSIHGERRQITLPTKIEISGSDVRATGTFVVPYVAWGMKNPSTLILRVNDKVKIEFTAIGRITKASY